MAKSSKKVANYRKGSTSDHCGICTMFRAPHSCTAVEGEIDKDYVCDYFKRKVFAVADKTTEKFGVDFTCRLEAASLNVPNEPHPNKMPFSGILTRIDEPSDSAPGGAKGRRVIITKEAAENALDSLLGMAVDYVEGWDDHNPQQKIGVITDANIDGNAININGYIWSADFPEVAKEIKANKDKLGFSFEAQSLMTTDLNANPVPICECVFTGAAILLKDKAAYTSTSINAARVADGEFSMTKEELQAIVAAAVAPLADKIEAQGKTLEAQGKVIADAEAARVEAANHMPKIERHAAELEKVADHFDAAGIGGDAQRGHAAVLRDMAGDLRAKAARGVMASTYDRFWASAEKPVVAAKVDVEGAVKAAADKVTAEMTQKVEELKAAAEKAEKALKDQLEAAKTEVSDLSKKLQAKADEPARKTLSPANMRLLAKSGVEMPQGEGKLSLEALDKSLKAAGLDVDQRFALKADLARAGVLD